MLRIVRVDYDGDQATRAPATAAEDRYAHLRVVGAGVPFRAVRDDERLVAGLRPGEFVHVLLDDGRVIETTLRITADQGDLVWLSGVSGGYAHSRVRPVGGWDE